MAGDVSFRSHAEAWLAAYLEGGGHDGQGGRNGQGYRSILDAHLLPQFGDRPLAAIARQEYRAFIKTLKTRKTRRGKRIAPRTVINVHRCAQRIFEAAVEEELLDASPVRLAKGDLPKERDADPAWRPSSRFTLAELKVLFTDPRIPLLHRVAFCLLFFFAGRSGEVAALVWSRWDPIWEPPLGRITISHAYSTVDDVMRPNKTGIAREYPVHPFLAGLLERWYAGGWYKLTTDPEPEPGDLIVPGEMDVDGTLLPLRNDRLQDWLRAACKTVGIRPRNPSAFRPSFISIAQAAFVPSELVEALTHPNSKEVFSGYSRFTHAEKSEAIKRIALD